MFKKLMSLSLFLVVFSSDALSSADSKGCEEPVVNVQVNADLDEFIFKQVSKVRAKITREIAAVQLGMNEDQVQAALGKPLDKLSRRNNLEIWIYKVRNSEIRFQVIFTDHKVKRFSSKYTTQAERSEHGFCFKPFGNDILDKETLIVTPGKRDNFRTLEKPVKIYEVVKSVGYPDIVQRNFQGPDLYGTHNVWRYKLKRLNVDIYVDPNRGIVNFIEYVLKE